MKRIPTFDINAKDTVESTVFYHGCETSIHALRCGKVRITCLSDMT